MKRHMLLAAFALATVALLGFVGSTLAEEGQPFRLTGTVTDVDFLGYTEDTLTLQMTSSGEGTIGDYEQISIVTFTHVGGTTWKFEGETIIYLLNDAGYRTGDEIYIAEHGTWKHGNQGSFRIIGSAGLYEGASGSGAFKFDSPTATYNGVIH